MIKLELPESELDKLVDECYDKWIHESDRDVTPVSLDQIRFTQSFILDIRVDFYVDAIKSGMYPQPVQGLRLPNGSIFVIDGHHRAMAWIKCGWVQIPMQIQEPRDRG